MLLFQIGLSDWGSPTLICGVSGLSRLIQGLHQFEGYIFRSFEKGDH